MQDIYLSIGKVSKGHSTALGLRDAISDGCQVERHTGSQHISPFPVCWRPLVMTNERARSSPGCDVTSPSEDRNHRQLEKHWIIRMWSLYWKPLSLIVLLNQKKKNSGLLVLRGPFSRVRKLPVVVQSALANRPRLII
jgi:hypothetical protein